ncbi:MAG: ribosome biogenesis GTP-binding protein YihA/YsxC [Proteobacteria bacterium]|nr:ribosome biogenesis GTP-binding protein YihA/YsxC [Pseudomonadota bacterium]
MKILNAVFLKSVTSYDNKKREDLPEVAFIGRSNVGKSSMINRLVMQKIARTSSTPGRTRSINLYKIEYEFKNAKKSFFISDFPGFGYSKVSREVYQGWQEMIEQYILQNSNIKRLIWLFDGRRDLDELDNILMEWLEDNRIPFSFVITKIDKATRNETTSKKALFNKIFGPEHVFIFSAKSGDGRKELLSHIFNVVEQ